MYLVHSAWPHDTDVRSTTRAVNLITLGAFGNDGSQLVDDKEDIH
jgi:hypothetical protein